MLSDNLYFIQDGKEVKGNKQNQIEKIFIYYLTRL